MMREGVDLGPGDVTASARILESQVGEPRRGARPGDPDGSGQEHPAEDARPEGLRRRDRREHDRVRHRPRRHRQDLPRDGEGRAGAAAQRGQPHHPDPPAVEAGERLGFLPGTLNDKIDPYLRPLYDALNEMMDPELVPKLMASGTIEVAPLAYMRGRTLNDSFVVLDEAQNTTPEQMKMFLTRLGFGTRMVVTGDITQVDLPAGASGCSWSPACSRHRRHPLRATDQRRRRAPHPGRPHRRRVHEVRRREASSREVRAEHEPQAATRPRPRTDIRGR